MKHEEYSEYIANMSEKVLDAIEDIFEKSEPQPTGCGMIDTMAFVSVLVFARQINMQCDSKKSMQSLMRSTMVSLRCQIDALAEPLIKNEKPWDNLFGEASEKGGENDKV